MAFFKNGMSDINLWFDLTCICINVDTYANGGIAASNWDAKAQYWGGFKSPVLQGVFLLESIFNADSHTVCAIACINICAHITNPNTGNTLFGHTKILHILIIKVGSTPRAVAKCSSIQEGWPEFPSRDKCFLQMSLRVFKAKILLYSLWCLILTNYDASRLFNHWNRLGSVMRDTSRLLKPTDAMRHALQLITQLHWHPDDTYTSRECRNGVNLT